jgi:glycosyltransferase involved in cell wall biosynthesis
MQTFRNNDKITSPPYLADVGVIGLVPDVWEAAWQPRHHVLTRLSRYFNVVWYHPVSYHPGQKRRNSLLPLMPWNQEVDYSSAVSPGLTVYNPDRWLPKVHRPSCLTHWIVRWQLRRAKQILHTRGCHKIILYLWRQRYDRAQDMIGSDLSCYHIDDEYTFSEVEKPITESEARLISRVDQVFIHSTALLEKKGHLNPHTAFVPNGVDYHAYVTPRGEPADLKPIPHPRIGYVGRIRRYLDIALLIALAQRHQQWSFVLVGPLRLGGPEPSVSEHAALIQKLSQLPNVHFLGGKPVHMLPSYTQHLDVCIMCYKVNDYTKFIYPLKLHEYLASGRPVVGSPIQSLQEFAHIIRLARTTDEWSQALSDSLAPAICHTTQSETRQNIARQHDWNRLVGFIARTLCERLGPTYLKRFEEIPADWNILPDGYQRNSSKLL